MKPSPPMRWNNFAKAYEGMPSPIAQNERHVLLLREIFDTMELPTRLGMRLKPKCIPYVLVSPKARIIRSSKFDSSKVIKADTFRQQAKQHIDDAGVVDVLVTATRFVSSYTAHGIAERLVQMHRPAPWPGFEETCTDKTARQRSRADAPPAAQTARPTQAAQEGVDASQRREPEVTRGPSCKKCRGRKGAILSGRYGYYFKCGACQANTHITFACEPGHKPRLRKSGGDFYRDCADCETSTLYFTSS